MGVVKEILKILVEQVDEQLMVVTWLLAHVTAWLDSIQSHDKYVLFGSALCRITRQGYTVSP